MVNGKTPYVLILIAAILLLGMLLILQPYSVISPWHAYTKPVRRFLGAAARRDTAELTRQSLGVTAVQWALAAAQRRPESLAYWARHAEAWTGSHRGDTVEVFVDAPNSGCDLVVKFVGPAGTAKVEGASSACFEGRRPARPE
jgi:hypothetical protein